MNRRVGVTSCCCASGVAVDGEVELVLHRGEERLRRFRLRAVIHGGGVNVGDLLVEPPLAGADFADFRQQVIVILLAQKRSVFQALT